MVVGHQDQISGHIIALAGIGVDVDHLAAVGLQAVAAVALISQCRHVASLLFPRGQRDGNRCGPAHQLDGLFACYVFDLHFEHAQGGKLPVNGLLPVLRAVGRRVFAGQLLNRPLHTGRVFYDADLAKGDHTAEIGGVFQRD